MGSACNFASLSSYVPLDELACLQRLCLVCLYICESLSMCAWQGNISGCGFGPSMSECGCAYTPGLCTSVCLCGAFFRVWDSKINTTKPALPACSGSACPGAEHVNYAAHSEGPMGSEGRSFLFKVNSRGKSTTEELSWR